MNQRKTTQSVLLFLQIIITLVYGAMLVYITMLIYEEKPNSFWDDIIGYLPQFVILVSSIIPQIVLRAKRKLHSQDGEIFPLLFTMVALQVTFVVPMFTKVTGMLVFSPSFLVIFGRFSLLGTAALFLISSLRYYGFSSSKIGYYNTAILIASLLISMLAPISSFQKENIMNVFNSEYDVFIQVAILLMYTATILTLLIYAIKDKSPINTRRFFGFTFVIIGLYLSTSYEYLEAIISSILYMTGIIILTFNTRESF